MKWLEITVNTTTDGAELVADAFFSAGCTGVKIIDGNDLADIMKSGVVWDYIDDTYRKSVDGQVKVSGFASEEGLDKTIEMLKEELAFYNCGGEISVTEADESSWYDNWKKYYSPIEAGRYIIVPEWLEYDGLGNLIPIFIDPGMAFGTGEHESTRMCLLLMSELEIKGKSVIDVGTGSGILGIAAVKSGAESCYMCDIDSVAVKAAKENAKLNGIENADIELADLLSGGVNKKADIILANLTADILIRLSKDAAKFLNGGGHIVCSGIIHSRKDGVIKAFEAASFSVTDERVMGEWDALVFKRK